MKTKVNTKKKVSNKQKSKPLKQAAVMRSLLEEAFHKGWQCASSVWEAKLIKEKDADWHRENYRSCEKKYIDRILKDFA
mgnify:CR=1 FL=1